MLIEHFNGAFPLWLSPEQVRFLPISDKFNDYADTVAQAGGWFRQGFTCIKIKGGRDLGKQHHLLVHRQGTGKGHALLLAAG